MGWIGGQGHRQNRRVPDAIFDDPRLAQVYDPLDPDRSDLDVYVDLVSELGARSVLDVGCGTGTFACLLDEAFTSRRSIQRKPHSTLRAPSPVPTTWTGCTAMPRRCVH